MRCLDVPIREINSGNSFATDFLIAQGGSIFLTSVFGQGFCDIVMPNLSKRSRPRIGQKPSATTVIFAF